MEILLLFLISLTLFHFSLHVKNDELLSEGMLAEQISTFNNSVASLAVDGEHLSNTSCSQTTEITNPWWQVYLRGGYAFITNVTIYSSSSESGNGLSGIKVLLSISTKEHNRGCSLSGSTNVTTPGEILVFKCSKRFARIIRIQLFDNTTIRRLSLCEVKVFGQWMEKYELLSDNMPASQSSMYLQHYATNAFDDLSSSRYQSCSCTNNQTNPWWQMYLEGGIARVKVVSFFNNVDELSRERSNEFKVSVSDIIINPDFLQCTTRRTIQSPMNDGQFVIFRCIADGRIVRIQLIDNSTTRYLSLCDMKVYGHWIEKDNVMSYGMPATQSSSNLATNALFALDNDCSFTKANFNPWWQVYLEKGIARVTIVSVHNIHYCCVLPFTEFKLLVSNSTKQEFSECASAPDNPTEEIINLECNTEARIVRLQMLKNVTSEMALCDVRVYGEWIEKDELLTYDRPASQSSTYSNFYATLAIDGNTSNEESAKSCSATTKSQNPWWQVYLLEFARVSTVSVYYNVEFRGEALTEFQVLMMNSTDEQNVSQCNTMRQHIITDNRVMVWDCYTVTKIVRIQLFDNNTTRYLSLCEVKVYGQWVEKYELLSDDMPTSQSSTHSYLSAELAVDGNQSSVGKSCSVTGQSIDPWWQVSLEKGLARVRYVAVYNISTRWSLNEFKVLVSHNITNTNFSECASAPKSTTNNQILNLLECHAEARIVRIQRSGAGKYLSLCDVRVYGQWIESDVVLLSEGMPASQSSTFPSVHSYYSASSAVDGDINQSWAGNSCSCTDANFNPWWQVKLILGLARVGSVSVYLRGGGLDLKEFNVLVSNYTTQNFSTCSTSPEIMSPGEIIILNCNAVGRIVRIQHTGEEKQYLTLCEVRVYGQWIVKDELLSEGMPASQRSSSLAAMLAVDGNTNQSRAGKSCSFTNSFRGNIWWQVFLEGGVARVGIVSVYTIDESFRWPLSEYEVMVSNDTENNFSICSYGRQNPKVGEILYVECHAAAKIVRIQAYSQALTFLSLCEVKVYGHWIEKYELLSDGMSASQSSKFSKFGATLPIDKITNPDGKLCMFTNSYTDPTPWWQVYLVGGLARVVNVIIYNERILYRLESSRGNLSVSNSTMQNFSICATAPENTDDEKAIILECNKVARIVQIQRENKMLVLCDVRIYGQWIEKEELLSQGMATNQSSTFRAASLAVDGNTNQYSSGGSCAKTTESIDPWWQVNLNGRLARVTYVSVYSIADYYLEPLSGLKVSVSNSTALSTFSICATGPKNSTIGQIINLECKAEAKIVRLGLYSGNKTVLRLCEVKVYGNWIRNLEN